MSDVNRPTPSFTDFRPAELILYKKMKNVSRVGSKKVHNYTKFKFRSRNMYQVNNRMQHCL